MDAFLSGKISEEKNVKQSPKYKTHLVLKMHIVRRGDPGYMEVNFKSYILVKWPDLPIQVCDFSVPLFPHNFFFEIIKFTLQTCCNA